LLQEVEGRQVKCLLRVSLWLWFSPAVSRPCHQTVGPAHKGGPQGECVGPQGESRSTGWL